MIHGLGIVAAIVAVVSAGDDASFETKIRPVLAGVCVRCHGPQKASGGLRLDSREALLRGGENGPAADPGHPEESLILRAIRREDDIAPMPPDRPLPPGTADDLRRWIATGLPWPDRGPPMATARHWAFEPVRAIDPPGGSAGNPIDAFLAAEHRKRGLSPAPKAEARTLIRRATFDLTGLPPSPEEVEAFVNDRTPDAFAKAVDRLLASPRYGEHWGRRWLDVARYADTAGETADMPVPDAWRYRNYVIDSLNADKPYDRFLREQVAGDILARELPDDAPPGRYAELVTATGYLAIARRFGFDSSKDQHLTIDDTIDAFTKGVLGLTVACARCHDHKYDPISATDYYALYGIFDSTRYPRPGCEKDPVPRDNAPLLSPSERDRRLASIRARLAEAGVAIEARDAARRELDAFDGSIPRAYAVAEGRPHDARVQVKGDPATLGPEVPRRSLGILGGRPIARTGESGRRDLADWIADPGNPLTARVIVNRVWQAHFGKGLARTPDNLGVRGEPSDHPELLDWLAARFVRDGWSLKALHRLILSSDAYRRSIAVDARNAGIDHDNLTLWRFERRRLMAEEIRDAMLAVSGDLDPTPGGPHPFPEPKTWRFTQHNPFTAVYDHRRRSVYLMTQRIKRHPFLALFDGPDPNSCTGRRDSTTVPTQALFYLNDPFVHARAASLARRLSALPDDAARIDRASQILFGRPAREGEAAIARRFLTKYAEGLGAKPADERQRLALAAWVRVLFSSNEFVYVD